MSTIGLLLYHACNERAVFTSVLSALLACEIKGRVSRAPAIWRRSAAAASSSAAIHPSLSAREVGLAKAAGECAVDHDSGAGVPLQPGRPGRGFAAQHGAPSDAQVEEWPLIRFAGGGRAERRRCGVEFRFRAGPSHASSPSGAVPYVQHQLGSPPRPRAGSCDAPRQNL